MAWALQFFVFGCLAVVTYESHHLAGYLENKCCIIKGVKMLFFKCYPNVLSYKFDMCNGYKDDILLTDASVPTKAETYLMPLPPHHPPPAFHNQFYSTKSTPLSTELQDLFPPSPPSVYRLCWGVSYSLSIASSPPQIWLHIFFPFKVTRGKVSFHQGRSIEEVVTLFLRGNNKIKIQQKVIRNCKGQIGCH